VIGGAMEKGLNAMENQPGLNAQAKALLHAYHRDTLTLLRSINRQPEVALANKALLQRLLETPLVAPALDHHALERVLQTFPASQGNRLSATHLSVYLLDRRQLLRYARSS
jgi:hypothetical protein